jgi:hypothetical protein
MPGGLLQLVASGSQDLLLNGNASVSFFKKVYKTYTNFAMESMRVTLNRTSMNYSESTTLVARFKRHADLVQDVYLSIEIPEIRKVDKEQFAYVRHFGETLIKSYSVYVGGTVVDKQTGEWLHLWNQLSMSADKRYGYDQMIGNTNEIFAPDNNHWLKHGEVQVRRTRLYIPLRFWFNRSPGLALPLVALQYHDVEIHIELRPMRELFTINGLAPSGRVSYFPNEVIDVTPYLETNYIFLDTNERAFFARSSHDYLIEQTNCFVTTNVDRVTNTEITVSNPVKEFVWVFTSADAHKTNSWFDYGHRHQIHSSSCMQTNSCDCGHGDGYAMESARIMFNGLERVEAKSPEYYNLLQPYQHHSVIPGRGIYCYSFSLHPEQFQPSGACNLARIKRVQLQTVLEPSAKHMDLRVYVLNYNFLRVMAGLGGLGYA